MKNLLWRPFRIGQMELRNRIAMAPITTQYASKEGHVTKRLKDHYEARARGGTGLLIVEATYIHPQGQAFDSQLNISAEELVSGLGELVQVIHKHGAKAAIQLHHGGRMARSELTGMEPVAPSPLARPKGEVPRELPGDEIAELVVMFA